MANIEHGDRGAAVLILQGVLHKLGYEITNTDGIFGGETYNAIEAFQENHGLDVDGVVGGETAQAIVSAIWELGDAGEWDEEEDVDYGDSDEYASNEEDYDFDDENVSYDDMDDEYA